MKRYFAKYFPVEGEIKEGDKVLLKKKDGSYAVFTRMVENDPEWAAMTRIQGHIPLQLDEMPSYVQYTHPKDLKKYKLSLFSTEAYQTNEEKSLKDFLIGEVSPEATWVKEKDEFNEDEVEQDTEVYGWNKEYNTEKDFRKFFDKTLSKKATHFEYMGETDYLDENGTINLNFKVYLKTYKIKGPCGHFH